MTNIELKLIKEQVSKPTMPNADLIAYRNRLKPFIEGINGILNPEILEIYDIIAVKLTLPNLVKEITWLTGVQ